MRFNCKKKTKQDYYDWLNTWVEWFAWYPVRINNECVWLETVLRKPIEKTYATYDDWQRYEYRL